MGIPISRGLEPSQEDVRTGLLIAGPFTLLTSSTKRPDMLMR
jgi:hypothetical protein